MHNLKKKELVNPRDLEEKIWAGGKGREKETTQWV